MERMEKSVANVQERFATVRTGRANPNALDRIMVWSCRTPAHGLLLCKAMLMGASGPQVMLPALLRWSTMEHPHPCASLETSRPQRQIFWW